jgi:cellulose synthase/poly-beta-1,6-N-acetylglucosamine synthase-like glycosyltransferase/spore germination protein YaaH/peptidoglycan/xylan/chitin deacetylase (PgdA/CDA1 family)
MQSRSQTPIQSVPAVFYDPRNVRWRRFSLAAVASGSLLTAIFVGLVLSVMVTPFLPGLTLAPVSRLIQQSHASVTAQTIGVTDTNSLRAPALGPLRSNPAGVSTRSRVPAVRNLPLLRRFHSVLVRSSLAASPIAAANQTGPITALMTPTPAPPLQPVNPAATGNTQVIGFFVNWDDNSFTSLKQNINHLDKLIPEWLHLAGPSGSIAVDDPVRQQEALNFIQQTRGGLPIVPLVNNYNNDSQSWDSAALAQMLSNPAARARNISELLSFVQSNHFAGISIDYEDVPPANQPDLTSFMGEIYSAFHPLGLEVSLSVPADDDSYDYKALAQRADYLILMAYDEHWDASTAGPVASQQFFTAALKARFSEVDPSKYIVGIGSYGYDWGPPNTQTAEVSFEQATQTAQQYGAAIRFDPVSLNSTYAYTDSLGAAHDVWFLDGLSAFNQIAATHAYGVRGYALWRMGSEDPSVWGVLDHRTYLDQKTAAGLQDMQYGYDVAYQGSGEVLRVTAAPSAGHRTIGLDRGTGLITQEQFVSYPSSYLITRWGAAAPNKLALTFDDGPDPTWTPKVLSILARDHVPATFFVIGASANLNPGLLQQIVSQGNEVGNHTFSHPDLSAVSDSQVMLELNAAQRLFESVLGRRSVLFRPPYAEDIEPATPDQVRPLLLSGQLGYYTVGMHIDPQDYLQPGVSAIVQRVLDQVSSGAGNVILLHDGGGDRSQTVAALPLIIQDLQARGYQLVTVSDLLGLSRDEVMPPVSSSEKLMATVSGLGFQTTDGITQFLGILFLVGIGLSAIRFVGIMLLAVIQNRRARKARFEQDFQPGVSIVVPAFNEAAVIGRTLSALLSQSYPVNDIVVVDDGSTDDTYQQVAELSERDRRVLVVRRHGSCKAEALNLGFDRATSDLILAIDADTVMHPCAVAKLVRHFADAKVAAVAGNAKVGNRINLLTNWQALEYITGQNLDRRAFALTNSIQVVPGAIGMWRREAVRAVGGFAADTLAEDADLTLRLLRANYRVEYDEEAIAFTEAPDTVRSLTKQRFRWMYGTLQAAWKQRDAILRPHSGGIGLLALPNIFIFQVLLPVVSPLLDLVALLSIGMMVWRSAQHPLDPTPTGLATLVFFYALFLLLDSLTAVFAFLLERREDWRLISWLLLQRFSYRQLMYYVAVKSMTTAIRGRLVGWGKLERKATIRASL